DYSGNSYTGAATTNSVRFVYVDRPDVRTGYVGGSVLSQQKVLSRIETFSAENVITRYQLAYTETNATKRARLFQLVECAAATNECLAPVTFSSQDGAIS